MPQLRDIETLNLFKSTMEAVPLDQEIDPGGPRLFDAVELNSNKQLGRALDSLLIGTKKRVALIVPLAIRRVTRDTSGASGQLSLRYIEASLLFTDIAYYKSAQRVMFGSDGNLGLLELAQRVEDAICMKDLTGWGGVLFEDGSHLSFTEKDLPGTRECWEQAILIPAGATRADLI